MVSVVFERKLQEKLEEMRSLVCKEVENHVADLPRISVDKTLDKLIAHGRVAGYMIFKYYMDGSTVFLVWKDNMVKPEQLVSLNTRELSTLGFEVNRITKIDVDALGRKVVNKRIAELLRSDVRVELDAAEKRQKEARAAFKEHQPDPISVEFEMYEKSLNLLDVSTCLSSIIEYSDNEASLIVKYQGVDDEGERELVAKMKERDYVLISTRTTQHSVRILEFKKLDELYRP